MTETTTTIDEIYEKLETAEQIRLQLAQLWKE